MSTIFAENRLEWRIFSEKDLPKLKNTYIVLLLHSPIAQSVEQRTVNPWVVGSSPTRGATSSFRGLQEEKSASLRCRVFFYFRKEKAYQTKKRRSEDRRFLLSKPTIAVFAFATNAEQSHPTVRTTPQRWNSG